MFKKISVTPLLWAMIVVPLNNKSTWQDLSYSKIPSHKVTFSEKGLNLKVQKSAMPLIYPFKKVVKIKKIKFSGHVTRLVQIPAGKKQGTKGSDDYVFQLGLVKPGKRTLNFFEKAIAASWVTKLFSLAPKGKGVDHIMFYRVYQDKTVEKKITTHPLGKGLIKVKPEWHLSEAGGFEYEIQFPEGQDVAALWLSSDGDDTGSEFDVTIKSMTIESL